MSTHNISKKVDVEFEQNGKLVAQASQVAYGSASQYFSVEASSANETRVVVKTTDKVVLNQTLPLKLEGTKHYSCVLHDQSDGQPALWTGQDFTSADTENLRHDTALATILFFPGNSAKAGPNQLAYLYVWNSSCYRCRSPFVDNCGGYASSRPEGQCRRHFNSSYPSLSNRFTTDFANVLTIALQPNSSLISAAAAAGQPEKPSPSVFEWTADMRQNGVYTYLVIPDPGSPSNLQVTTLTTSEGDDAFLPILSAFGVLCAMVLVWVGVLAVQKHRRASMQTGLNREGLLRSSTTDAPSPATKKGRLKSLDTFRGISLTIMIFVNYGGGGYWFFDHSYWNGLTVADLVFPWFMFMMGVSMALSFKSLSERAVPLQPILFKVLNRSFLLFAIGMVFINGGYDYQTWRVPGVLQRFSISFLVVSLIVVLVPPGLNKDLLSFPNKRGPCRDVAPFVGQWACVAVLCAVWLAVTFGLDVPGCGRGYLGPGGDLGDFGKHKDAPRRCTGGAAGYIDELLLTKGHIYGSPTCKHLYQTKAYDPEGILGSLTSIVMTFLGYHIGRVVLLFKDHNSRLKRWAAWGCGLVLLSLCLCGFKQNGGPIPINKNLWSLSFILMQAGTGTIALALCYITIDIFNCWNGAPFIYVGMNSILIYTGSEVFQNFFPFSFNLYGNQTHSLSLAENLIGVACWQFVAYYCYRQRFFLKV
eukprot:CAMPEP_0175126666 /NCGR_PEP_ID=MMETSP0087-20121206/3980_1 /TAXON_ID=136419 /ORGANISM="Unknown Unknown, Strain D1" /LENGTH=700 /DNA_ID=CAMNT_0016408603 /DNA_START=118 /DNA_END=2220 /DNA_ORIENTATION=+